MQRIPAGYGARLPRNGGIDVVRSSFEIPEAAIPHLDAQLNGLNGMHNGFSLARELQEAKEFKAWQAQHPCMLAHFEVFAERVRGRRVVVFLDYDGTLTPIVKNPDRAYLSDQMRETVRQIARLFPTAIISGRGREKVQDFVQLPELYYAGSHGLDIAGPQGHEGSSSLCHQPAAHFGPVMDELHCLLSQRVAAIPGAAVEHNKFCVSVHFRNCEPQHRDAVFCAVEGVVAGRPDVRATRGRKVLEVKPKVDWDKGRALLHLLEALGLAAPGAEDVVPLYLGDDSTDEDAFAVLRSQPGGCGILVSRKVKPTAAAYSLRDPSEVMAFLNELIGFGRSPGNGWLKHSGCVGWSLKADAAAGSAGDAPQQQLPTPLQQQPQQLASLAEDGEGGG